MKLKEGHSIYDVDIYDLLGCPKPHQPNSMTTANLHHTKIRCMGLLFRLAGNLRSVDFPKEERENARLALEEFRLLSDMLFAYTTDAEFEPSRETLTIALDELERAINKTEPRLNFTTSESERSLKIKDVVIAVDTFDVRSDSN